MITSVMSTDVAIPSFRRIKGDLLVRALSGLARLHYDSNPSFREDYTTMVRAVCQVIHPVHLEIRGSVVEAVTLTRLHQLGRGLRDRLEAFDPKSIAADPEVYRTVLDELERLGYHDRQDRVHLFADFIGLEPGKATEIELAKDTYARR
jgi:hypothetical protein